jgi:hypothetical protein
VIIPPPPASISQPSILEEPPIPVGLQVALEPSPQQQQHTSIALVLPTNKSETTATKKSALDLSNAEDSSATLSQQEELSVKGQFAWCTTSHLKSIHESLSSVEASHFVTHLDRALLQVYASVRTRCMRISIHYAKSVFLQQR